LANRVSTRQILPGLPHHPPRSRRARKRTVITARPARPGPGCLADQRRPAYPGSGSHACRILA